MAQNRAQIIEAVKYSRSTEKRENGALEAQETASAGTRKNEQTI